MPPSYHALFTDFVTRLASFSSIPMLCSKCLHTTIKNPYFSFFINQAYYQKYTLTKATLLKILSEFFTWTLLSLCNLSLNAPITILFRYRCYQSVPITSASNVSEYPFGYLETACWGHPKPQQKTLTLFCEHALQCGFGSLWSLICTQSLAPSHKNNWHIFRP